MKPYRSAVIGCGLIGSRFAGDAGRIGVATHAGAYAGCGRTRLDALCDADGVALAEAGDRWSVEARYSDPVRLLAERQPEIVSICTPDPTHAPLLRQVLAVPGVRAVFAEKPLALDLAEARAVLALAEDKPLLVNYARRFATSHQALKARLEAGAIGRMVAVQGIYTKGLLHNGTHWLDLARWLVGEVAAVQAFDALHEGGADPTLDLRLQFASGATGTLTGLSARDYSIFEMDILGTAGRARLSDGGWSVELMTVAPSPRYTGYNTLGAPVAIEGGLRDLALRAVENLTAHLDDPRVPLACTGRDGLQVLLMAEAARHSLATGHYETVPAL